MANDKVDFWVAGLGAAASFISIWAALWNTYGVWAAILGWIPAVIIALLVGVALIYLWRIILAVVGLVVVWIFLSVTL